eukprot:GILI01017495.1.p1 GENE.GILI01017495.1~~GILI01017495.1.p1  ORF type:complete len:684 (-),score=106.77 GILI01017495.1:56-2068(-)
MAESLKERLCVKLNIRSGIESLERALLRHIEQTNVKSAAAYLVPSHARGITVGDGTAVYLPKNALLLLYTVEGVVDPTGDAQVFVLDRTTMELHRQHASHNKTIHYVALSGQGSIPAADLSLVSKDIPPKGDHVDVVAHANWDEVAPVLMTSFDASPSSAILPSSTQATQIITRSSSPLVDAIAAAEAADRGVANLDYDTAMTQCCAWLAETIEIIEAQFSTSEAAASSTLEIIEAFLQRNSSLHMARAYIATDGSVFSRIEKALHSNNLSRQRWIQKRAALDCLAESTRLCATWISMLSSHALSLRIRNPAASQSLDGTNDTMTAISSALQIILASFPGQSLTESDQFAHYVQQRLIPRITLDLVAQVEKLLSLGTIFDVGAASIPVMPLCVTEGIQSHFITSSWALRRWLYAWHQVCATIHNVYPARLTETATVGSEAARYASQRCERLQDLLHKVNRASLGIMNTEMAVLYKTIHVAANAFPLLRASDASNWDTFEALFNKTLALKYTQVEPEVYAQPQFGTTDSSPIAPFSPMLSQLSVNLTQTQTTLHNHSRSMVNASMASIGNNSALVEEREVLASRVTIMAQELAEARQLIASLQGQVQRSNAALASAQELNVFMMAEIRKAKLNPEEGKAASGRADLVKRLAQEEHSRRANGRQIEDEELDN